MTTERTLDFSELEAEMRETFEEIRNREVETPSDLPEKAMNQIHAEISAQDLVELGTWVLFREFLCPILDIFAHTLGLDERRRSDD